MIDALMQACVDEVFNRHRRPGDSQRFEGLAQVPLNWVGGAAFDAIHRADDFLNAVTHRAGELAVEQQNPATRAGVISSDCLRRNI